MTLENWMGSAVRSTRVYAWSPDGNQILLFLTNLLDDGTYQINLYRTDLETGEKLELAQSDLFTETDYFYLDECLLALARHKKISSLAAKDKRSAWKRKYRIPATICAAT